MKSNSATPFCKICFKDIEDNVIASLWGKERFICSRCFHKMNPSIERFEIKGIKVTSLYEYNEEIRNLLFLFKGCGDIELAPVFLSEQSSLLRFIFHGFYLVNSPSYHTREEKRGFSHVKEMFKVLNLPFIDCLEKTKDVKQADLKYKDRLKVKDYIKIRGSPKIRGKKILFVDDVLTSGATSLASASLLKKQGAKEVQILVMAHTHLS